MTISNTIINTKDYITLSKNICAEWRDILRNKYADELISRGVATIEKEDIKKGYEEANEEQKKMLSRIFKITFKQVYKIGQIFERKGCGHYILSRIWIDSIAYFTLVSLTSGNSWTDAVKVEEEEGTKVSKELLTKITANQLKDFTLIEE